MCVSISPLRPQILINQAFHNLLECLVFIRDRFYAILWGFSLIKKHNFLNKNLKTNKEMYEIIAKYLLKNVYSFIE